MGSTHAAAGTNGRARSGSARARRQASATYAPYRAPSSTTPASTCQPSRDVQPKSQAA
ncbi:MAG: hypothetical protein M0D55_14070 [Elusimicrobiota bacterium]|nr:MAG: hypothetical protein M0D55_14070 [Elusimicrobiota bacterium]